MEYAKDFLRFVLAHGPVEVDILLRLAAEEGIDPPLLHRAGMQLRCVVERKGSPWYYRAKWSLPGSEPAKRAK